MTFTNRFAVLLASSVLLPTALTLGGCGGTPAAGTGIAGGPPGLASGGASSIYILNAPATGSEQVLQFAAGANGAEFGPTATGAAVPTKTITLSGVTPSELGAIRIDSVNNLYALLDTEVGSGTTATASFSVVGIGPAETGVEAPSTQFTSTAITDPSPEIALH